MVTNSVLILACIVCLSSVVAFGVLWLIGRCIPNISNPSQNTHSQDASFLFHGELLVDHGTTVLPDTFDENTEWGYLRRWLSRRFPDLPEHLGKLVIGSNSTHLAVADSDSATLDIIPRLNATRIVLSDPSHPCAISRHTAIVAQNNLEDAHQAFQSAPYPIWKTSLNGDVIWQNKAYSDQPILTDYTCSHGASDKTFSDTKRVSVEQEANESPIWFEVRSSADENYITHYATDISKVVRAEASQREFVQTLTKTFAYLTIGLAVFDRKRQLALFNPALVDLTDLSAEFLSGRPDMISFFDNLRDKQVMPEPRSYPSWRAHINAVVQSANDGLYQETWSLPNDVTYKVTGRPHPDGAVAFLFEDISAEIMLARRFRAQLDLRQSALDNIPQAVMVFGSNNVLSFCNEPCVQLLGVDPDTSFADMSANDLMGICNSVLPQMRLWKRVEAGLRQRQIETPIREQAVTDHGVTLSYRVEPLAGGSRMLILDIETAEISDPVVSEAS